MLIAEADSSSSCSCSCSCVAGSSLITYQVISAYFYFAEARERHSLTLEDERDPTYLRYAFDLFPAPSISQAWNQRKDDTLSLLQLVPACTLRIPLSDSSSPGHLLALQRHVSC